MHTIRWMEEREREQERCIVYTNLTRWATKRKCWKPNNNVDNKFAHFAHSHRWQHLPLLLFHLLCAYQFTKTSVKTLNKNQKTFLVAILQINGKSCNLALFDFEEEKKWFKMNWLNRPIGVLLRTVICGLHFEYVQKWTFFFDQQLTIWIITGTAKIRFFSWRLLHFFIRMLCTWWTQ